MDVVQLECTTPIVCSANAKRAVAINPPCDCLVQYFRYVGEDAGHNKNEFAVVR